MKKTKKKSEPKKPPSVVEADPIPKFYCISQVLLSGQVKHLYPKPIFCTQERGLQLALTKCIPEGDIVILEVKLLPPDEQKLMFLESGELELLRYTKK